MAKRSKVGYFPTRGAYYTTINGKQHKLAVGPEDYDHKHHRNHGPTYLAAVNAFAELMVYGAADHAGDANTVRVLCEKYAESIEAESTRERFIREAEHFTDLYGEQAVGAMKPTHIDTFEKHLRTERKWTMTNFPMQQIKNAFVWGVKKKLITTNPFVGVTIDDHIPDIESQIIPNEVAEAVFAVASPYLRDLLKFMWHTGCRPNEAYNVQAKHYDREHKCFVFSKNAKRPEFVWKNARKTKRDRSIYLDDEMVPLIEAKIRKHPTGYLFRSKFGGQWNRLSVYQQIRRVKETHKIEGNITAYGFRHSYITDRLLKGIPVIVVAELCGTSVAMIQKTYSHIFEKKDEMREWLLKGVSSSSGKI